MRKGVLNSFRERSVCCTDLITSAQFTRGGMVMLAREHARASFASIADGAIKEDVATGLSVLGGIEERRGG